jgi:hypothetical protein
LKFIKFCGRDGNVARTEGITGIKGGVANELFLTSRRTDCTVGHASGEFGAIHQLFHLKEKKRE